MYGFFTRRNMITMLMSIELIAEQCEYQFRCIQQVPVSRSLDGIFFSIFIITIAAAEAAVAIAIIINLYRSHHSIDVETATELNG
jgi:NADH-quinone oxidoreductase subunit K